MVYAIFRDRVKASNFIEIIHEVAVSHKLSELILITSGVYSSPYMSAMRQMLVS